MPCKDTTSKVTVFLDANDRLVDYDFSKITCSKEIGGGDFFLATHGIVKPGPPEGPVSVAKQA
mgnify:CR=1 FL=1